MCRLLVNRDRAVQELIQLLVDAVLALPDSEKKCVLDKAITPLFEAVLTLNDAKQVPGIGRIWMTLTMPDIEISQLNYGLQGQH